MKGSPLHDERCVAATVYANANLLPRAHALRCDKLWSHILRCSLTISLPPSLPHTHTAHTHHLFPTFPPAYSSPPRPPNPSLLIFPFPPAAISNPTPPKIYLPLLPSPPCERMLACMEETGLGDLSFSYFFCLLYFTSSFAPSLFFLFSSAVR